MLIGHLWRNVSSSSLTGFEFLLLLSSWESSLYILDVNSLSGMWFGNIFSHFVGCLFCFLAFFDAQKFSVLMKFKLSTFAFCYPFNVIFWHTGVPRWLSGVEFTCQCRRCRRPGFDPCVGNILWRRAWQPTPVFLPGKSHGQRNLMGITKGWTGLSNWAGTLIGETVAKFNIVISHNVTKNPHNIFF